MKRCPQCEFIYEDEQDLCDMDGRELERAPAAAHGSPGAATRPTRTSSARRRRLLTLSITGGVLATILTSGYYVQTSQTAAGQIDSAREAAAAATRNEITPSTEPPAPAPAPAPESPRPAPAPSPKTKARLSAESPQKRIDAADKVVRPAIKSPAPLAVRREEKASRPESSDGRKESKKESKLGAALKKAGRVLKKPFRF